MEVGVRFFLTVIVIVAMGIVGLLGSEIVDTGHRGVETRFGEVQGGSLPEGLYFYNPFTSNIIEMDVRTLRWDGKEVTYTKDVQQAAITFTVNYNLKKEAVHTVYQEVGVDWSEILLPQIVRGVTKSVIGKWNATDLIANREKATAEIQDLITAELDKKNVTVTKFELTDVAYNDEFENAVEAKVTAIERAKEAENRTRQIEEEAKQKVIAAKAEAESMQIRTEALSQSKGLVEYEAVQKWNGILPQYMLGGTTPFINLSGK